jgi:hypothetical protein
MTQFTHRYFEVLSAAPVMTLDAELLVANGIAGGDDQVVDAIGPVLDKIKASAGGSDLEKCRRPEGVARVSASRYGGGDNHSLMSSAQKAKKSADCWPLGVMMRRP